MERNCSVKVRRIIVRSHLHSFFDILTPSLEVTSSIGKELSDLCSAGPSKSKTTPQLPISENFDFCGIFWAKNAKIRKRGSS